MHDAATIDTGKRRSATAHRLDNMAQLIDALGGISPRRIRVIPAPGQARERDVTDIHDREGTLCELIQGVLVEKPMGAPESSLAMHLGVLLGFYLHENEVGILMGPDGTLRFLPGLVYIPDLSFVRWEQLPDRTYPRKQIPDLVPDLVVEILSPSNTKKEMELKLVNYFKAGVRLCWIVDPRKRSIRVHSTARRFQILSGSEILTGEPVLPNLHLPLKTIFQHVPSVRASKRPRKRR